MQIRSEVRNDNTVIDLRGNWVTPPVYERLVRISKSNMFKENANMTLGQRDLLIEFKTGIEEQVIAQLTEYVQDNLYSFIGRAFTEIRVSPYHVPNNNNENGLGLLMTIVEETGCDVDYGAWNTAVTLKPSTSTQYNEITELLNLFELRYT